MHVGFQKREREKGSMGEIEMTMVDVGRRSFNL